MERAGHGNDVYAAIAAPVRREILSRLAEGELPVTELASTFEMSLSAISQHLAILRDANLVTIEKRGRQRVYRVNPEPLGHVAQWLSFYEGFWTDRFKRLSKYLEELP
jgi:DNA-binding transcriptional ArsR family regulator